MEIVRNLLELAEELFPKSAMVFNRWGDYFVKIKDKPKAILNYTKSLTLDPLNKELPTLIKQLKR